MSVYDINSNVLPNIYAINELPLNIAYDVSGNIVYSGGTSIKVMSYNVGNWYIGSGTNIPTDKKSIYETLQRGIFSRNACNVCALQEYWNNFCADGTTAVSILDDYYSSIDTIDGTTMYMGKAICMNMTPKTKTTQSYTQQSGTHKRFRINVVEINGHDIYFIDCHLDWSNTTYQYSQVQDLLNYISDKEYFVLCGDFNCTSVTPSEDRTSERYINVCKPFIDAGYNMANWKEAFIPTYYSGTSVEDSTTITCLDNIITSSNIGMSDVYVDTTKLTDNLNEVVDHLPIVADLILS